MSTVLVALLLAAVHNALSMPANTDHLKYLSRFGYLGSSVRKFSADMINMEDVTRAIESFQAFAGINVTGELDAETEELMSLPRCGVRDVAGPRTKRYTLQGSRWKIRQLTYRVNKYPRRMSEALVDSEIARAFQMWSEATDLTFERLTDPSSKAQIEIEFVSGEHGDGDPFDGPGGTLAHAFFPQFGGDVHFDDDERWTANDIRGSNLLQAAVHELGHSLGLSHSDEPEAIMAPFYRGFSASLQLHSDDVSAIQALYGKKLTDSSSHHDEGDLIPDENLCQDPKFDTIFKIQDREYYVFKGNLYWHLTSKGVAAGYPRLISEDWPGLPGDIDAAFTYRDGKTYFFKGPFYYTFRNRTMEVGYPKKISSGFPGIPDNIDTAFVWTGNNKIYFFKENQFWKYDPRARPRVPTGYPKPLSNWEGVPKGTHAAVVFRGYTFFFKDDSYYRFDDKSFKVDPGAIPPYPRSTSEWWFKCKGPGNNQRSRSPAATSAFQPVFFWIAAAALILLRS